MLLTFSRPLFEFADFGFQCPAVELLLLLLNAFLTLAKLYLMTLQLIDAGALHLRGL